MISIKTSKTLIACLSVIGLVSGISPAFATVFSIDDFSITRTRAGDTTTIFQDNFNNGVAPTNPPYFINGAIGTESDGRYRFDTATGAIFDATAFGRGQVRVASALFNPAVSNASTNLSNADAFLVTGVFDLITPINLREGYGIRLTDAGLGSAVSTNNGNDRLEILVRRTIDGLLAIQFRDSDNFQRLITLLGSADLDTTNDQIVLALFKEDAGVNAISAGYAYRNAGILGEFTRFLNTGTLFDGENFTRAEFRATTPVPIAPTLSLTLLGLMTMFAIRKRKA